MKIKPKLPKNKEFTQIQDLKKGDCFIADGELHILIDEDPGSINLSTGERANWIEGAEVIPVEVEATWERKLHKHKK